MTTASKLINDALVLLGVSSVINPPEPEQESYGLAALQGLVSEWTADDVRVWAAYPNDILDDLGESPELTESVKALLAKRIAAYMQVDIPGSLSSLISDAENRILSRSFDDGPIWPDNLPLGAGHSGPNRRTFFAGKVCNNA